jgi:hypothetical protein
MGYRANDRTRLDEARRRALELLDELPSGSRVAVLDPADPVGRWEASAADARRRLEDLKEPRGAAVPVTTALATAYQLLRTVDQEAEAGEPLSRLVVVFSDRTAGCWEAGRVADLVKLRDAVPEPKVAHLFLDVGIDQPANVAVSTAAVSPQILPRGQEVAVAVTVAAVGPEVTAGVRVKLVGPGGSEQRQEAKVPGGGTAGVTFRFDGRPLAPGPYQAEVRLETADKLPADDVRYLTFRVAEPRRILTLTDDPSSGETAPARFWQLAHDAKGEFACDVRKADPGVDLKGYEAVCLLSVADPSKLWPKLLAYAEAGGKVLVMPGADLDPEAYRPAGGEAAARLLPAALRSPPVSTAALPAADGKVPAAGVTWVTDAAALRHPLLKPFRGWKERGNVDVVQKPPRAWRYYAAEPAADGRVAVWYDDADDPKDRHPAVVERSVGGRGGLVLLLTTRMDTPRPDAEEWNSYWRLDESSWSVVFPNLLLRYMLGDPTEANFNYLTGQAVPVPLPRGEIKPGWKLDLQGPGVSLADAQLEVGENQTELRLPPARTLTAGNFTLATPDKGWRDGFSLNPPAEEGTLERLPTEAVAGLLGPDAVVPVDRTLALRDLIGRNFNQPIDLFPWLLLAVLAVVVAEPLVANKFYRQ